MKQEDCSFRFMDEDLNHRLADLFRRSGVRHRVDRTGVIHYSIDDEAIVENELICSIRDDIFSSWQVLSCPKDWATRYRRYMWRHEIPFTEERIDGEVSFLLPRSFRPQSWKLEARRSRKDSLAK